MRVAEQMRAFPGADWPGKFSVTHALPQALNRSIVLRNHKHAGTGPAQRHRSWVPAAAQPPRSPEGSGLGRKASPASPASPTAPAAPASPTASPGAEGQAGSETSELSTSYFRTPLFSLAPWEANTPHRQPCIRVLPQQTSRGGKKKAAKRSLVAAPLCQQHTSPRAEYTVYFPSH